MRLLHLRVPGISPYSHAAALQDHIVKQFLSFKATASSNEPPPEPTVITAQFHPVYTCGRREIGSISTDQQEFLRADGRADFVEALRGGQTTFHGPGQLIAYPIIDLKRHK